MHSRAQGIKAYADCHGLRHFIIFIVLIDNLRPVTHAKYRRSGKGRTKKHRTAQVQAQARPKVRPLVLGVDRVRRVATGPSTGDGLQKVDPCRAAQATKLGEKARSEKTGWRRTGRARSMPWSCPHENPQHVHHGDGQHLESEAVRAVLALHAPQAHQSLRRPATASPCKESETR